MALAKLQPVICSPAYELDEIKDNVRASMARAYPWLHQLPEFNKEKKGRPIALVGGGPSLRDYLDELRDFDNILAVGSAHDWLIQQGIKVRYCMAVDAHPTVTASYLKNPHVDTNYLVASQCNALVFDALQGYAITLWHCLSNDAPEWLPEINPGYQGLGGGCTAGLRAFGMAAILGYRDLHLFGYDSCIPDSGESHAYPLQDEEVENEGLRPDRVFNINPGLYEKPGERSFRCLGYHIAQAQNFEEFVGHHYETIKFTFHGDGLMKHVYDLIVADREARTCTQSAA